MAAGCVFYLHQMPPARFLPGCGLARWCPPRLMSPMTASCDCTGLLNPVQRSSQKLAPGSYLSPTVRPDAYGSRARRACGDEAHATVTRGVKCWSNEPTWKRSLRLMWWATKGQLLDG
jgi:hypothetical protein